MRRFEFRSDTSSKYWHVEVRGTQLHLGWGKIGTKGQSKTKEFDSVAEAESEAESLIAEKVRKGYREVTAPRTSTTTSGESSAPHGPKSPDDTSSTGPRTSDVSATRYTLRNAAGHTMVLTLSGASLLTGSDPDAVVQTFDSPADAKDHFERVLSLRTKDGYRVVGTETIDANLVPTESLEPDGFEGKVQLVDGRFEVTFRGPPELEVPVEICRGLVERIRNHKPRRVDLLCDLSMPRRSWEEALEGARLESVQGFVFDVYFQSQARQADNRLGDIRRVLESMPNLEKAFVNGRIALTATSHAKLRVLHLLGDPLDASFAKGLSGCSFPSLERLVLGLASDADPDDEASFVDALCTIHAPSLREVHLAGVDDVAGLLDRLASSTVPSPWETLTVAGAWDGSYDFETLRPVFEQHPKAFDGLRALGLDIEDETDARTFVPSVRVYSETDRQNVLPNAYRDW